MNNPDTAVLQLSHHKFISIFWIVKKVLLLKSLKFKTCSVQIEIKITCHSKVWKKYKKQI
jgi:hypothetical protein